jgi:hypothetical protein
MRSEPNVSRDSTGFATSSSPDSLELSVGKPVGGTDWIAGTRQRQKVGS